MNGRTAPTVHLFLRRRRSKCQREDSFSRRLIWDLVILTVRAVFKVAWVRVLLSFVGSITGLAVGVRVKENIPRLL